MDRYIDAELYKEELRRRQNRPDAQHLSFYIGVQIAIDLVDRAPEVELAPVIHGHWEMYQDETNCTYGNYACTNCHTIQGLMKYRYCPYCGAKMDEEVNK